MFLNDSAYDEFEREFKRFLISDLMPRILMDVEDGLASIKGTKKVRGRDRPRIGKGRET